MNEVVLEGCRPEPLIYYLKALSILRLVSEQCDDIARATWRQDTFVLQSKLTRTDLVDFFRRTYRPTPIVAPWAGGSGFFQKDNKEAVDAIAKSKAPRLELYREVISQVRSILKAEGQTTKPSGDTKDYLLRLYRRELPAKFRAWMDCAIVLQSDGARFPPLLGTGGNDGRLDFTQNFMQRLVEIGFVEASLHEKSEAWLSNALFGTPIPDLPSSAIGQFDPGRAGAPNSSQGFSGGSFVNPWDYVLMLEGALLMAGSVTRRYGVSSYDKASFPFTVDASDIGQGSLASKDVKTKEARGEIWLPIWERSTGLAELRLLFAEGRAQLGKRTARNGVDFARAIAGLGVDRGLSGFVRYGFLKRSGKAYLATPLGRFEAKTSASQTSLLFEIDTWLNRVRRAVNEKTAPARFRSTYRQLESEIFDYCRYGGEARFADVLAALGRMERELGRTGRKRGEVTQGKNVPPVPPLSLRWLPATNDGTPEWRIAMALASIQGAGDKLGALRVHLEPVSSPYKWDEGSKMVVWSAADLSRNLAAVMERRLMEAERLGVAAPPFTPRRFARPADVAAFLAGTLDEARLEDLLWGAMLINWSKAKPYPPKVSQEDLQLLPRQFALLKLLFLPEPGLPTAQGKPLWPEASILAALRAGEMNRACELAARRLRASGYSPLPSPVSGGPARKVDWGGSLDPTRLMAALLIPLAQPAPKPNQLPFIAQLALRDSQSITE